MPEIQGENVNLGLTDADFKTIEAAINAENNIDNAATTKRIFENITAMSAICVQIAVENVTCVHYALRVMSRMVASIDDCEKRWSIFDKVCANLASRPNSDYDKIWLQNVSYQRDCSEGKCPYDVRLCKLTSGEDVQLWDNSWLKPSLAKGLPMESICDRNLLSKLTPVIIFRETRNYYNL